MIYYRPDGTRFVLVNHTPEEWADEYLARLLVLGCSQMYARRVTRAIRQAAAAREEAAERPERSE